MSDEVEASLAAQQLVIPAWNRSEGGRKQPLAPAFEKQIRDILRTVADELQLDPGPIMGHRLCGTNGNHAYGCLICGKQERYYQLFQLHHYGATRTAADNQELKHLLRLQAVSMREQLRHPQAVVPHPSVEECTG